MADSFSDGCYDPKKPSPDQLYPLLYKTSAAVEITLRQLHFYGTKKTTVGSKKLTVYMTTKPSSKGASTYQIYYKQKGTSKWKSITTTSASKTIKKLKKGKKYYVKVRAYKTVGSTKYYSCWSKTSTSKKVK